MLIRRLLSTVLVLTVMGALLVANQTQEPSSGLGMSKAATAFLKNLNEVQKTKASFAYDDKERLNWHFIPRERKGLPLKELEGAALQSALALIRSGLSESGYDQTLNVMSLEETLYLLEGGNREERRAKRDPQKYFLSVFGTPADRGVWGWRLEGHHISLNYSVQDGKVVSSTPEFFGANPGTIEAGPGRTIRVLGPEEDIARQILKLCNDEQKQVCWVDKAAPDDLRGGGILQPEMTPAVGLPASKMSADQKKLLSELLGEYLKNMPADVVRERRERLEKAGIDNIHFAWWGDSERNLRHYYRVQGPTFIIEYNNTQNAANHVHSMWRDMAGDFAIPVAK